MRDSDWSGTDKKLVEAISALTSARWILSNSLDQESELTKLRKRVEILEDACKAVNEGFNKVMHPGKNWFPVMLLIPEALAKSAKIAEEK